MRRNSRHLHAKPLLALSTCLVTLLLMQSSFAFAYGNWQRNAFVILGAVHVPAVEITAKCQHGYQGCLDAGHPQCEECQAECETPPGIVPLQYHEAWWANFTLVDHTNQSLCRAQQHEHWLRELLATSGKTLRGLVAYSSPANYANFMHNNATPCSNNPTVTYNRLVGASFDPAIVDALYLWDEPTTKLEDGNPQTPDFHCQDCCSQQDGDCFRFLDIGQGLMEGSPAFLRCGGYGQSQAVMGPWNPPVEDAFAFVNLLPIQAANSYAPCRNDYDIPAAYRCYLKRYLDLYGRRSGGLTSQPEPAPVLSVDHYPFRDGEPSTNDDRWIRYFEGLKIQTELALEYSRPTQQGQPAYRIPMWRYVQVAPIEAQTINGFPTLDQVRWQVYTALAYGAKGIGYFTLSPVHESPEVVFMGGIWNEGGVTYPGSRHDFLRSLNGELRNLGGTLINLDWVATYHTDAGPHTGIDLLGNPHKAYNIVSQIQGDGGKALVSYFKHRTGDGYIHSGDDYILVVNKDRTTSPGGTVPNPRTFTITLTNPATIYEVSKTNPDQLQFVTGPNQVTFTSTLHPGEGRLYKLDDTVFEYIVNVNAIKQWGDRTYYGHDRGIVMVDYSTGWRAYAAEGSGTPFSCIDLAVDGDGVAPDGVFAVYRGLAEDLIPPVSVGHVANYNLDLVRGTWTWVNGTYGLPTAVALGPNRIIVGHKKSNNGNVFVFDGAFANLPITTASGLRVNDIEYQHVSPTYAWFVVAHQGGVKRFLPTAGFPNDYSWTGQSPIVDVETTPSYVFAAKDNGATVGRIDRLSATLVWSGFSWNDNGNQPRVVDLALDPAGNQIMAATIKTPHKFFRLTPTLSVEGTPYGTTSIPRCTHLDANLNALLASDLGVSRRSSTGGYYATQPPGTDDGTDVLSAPREITVECFPNPIALGSKVRLTLPVAGIVRVRVIDLMGREVAVLKNGLLDAGVHEMKWSPPTGRPGVYYVALDTDQGRVVRKAVVLQ